MCPQEYAKCVVSSKHDIGVKRVVVGMGHEFVERKEISAYLLELCGFVHNGVNQICLI